MNNIYNSLCCFIYLQRLFIYKIFREKQIKMEESKEEPKIDCESKIILGEKPLFEPSLRKESEGVPFQSTHSHTESGAIEQDDLRRISMLNTVIFLLFIWM